MKKITEAQFRKACDIVIKYNDQMKLEYQHTSKVVEKLPRFFKVKKEDKIMKTDLSRRTKNILSWQFGFTYDNTVSDLSEISEMDFLRSRNAGKGSLRELKEICYYAGIIMIP